MTNKMSRTAVFAVSLLLACGTFLAPAVSFADEGEASLAEGGVEEINEAYDFTVDTEEDGVGASAGISSGGWASLGSELSYMEFPEDAVSDDGEDGVWTYCIDISTSTEDGHKYSMTTLDAAEYYDEESADKIRSILTESYPSKTLSELEEKYGLEGLTDEEAYMATQWIIWYYSNPDGLVDAGGGKYYPANIYKPSDYPGDAITMWYEDEEGTEKRVRSTNVVKLAKLLDALKPAGPYETEPAEIVFNKTEYEDKVVFDYGESKGLKTLKDIVITVKDEADNDVPFIEDGTAITILYKNVDVSDAAAKLKLYLEAIQSLSKDAYFFSPEGGRDASQSRVAVYGGTAPVEASEEFTVPPGDYEEEPPGDPEDPGDPGTPEDLEDPEDPENPEACGVGGDETPKTGDGARAVPFALMVMAALSGAGVCFKRRAC